MKQVLLIHGGDSYGSYDAYIDELKSSAIDYERLKPQQRWKSWVAEQMPEADVLLPSFPNSSNAVYEEWKIYFEKLLPFLRDDVQLVGHSLGAMFLAKYLNAHALTPKVRRVILIAGAYDEELMGDSGSFVVGSAVNVPKSAEEVHLFHSEDDPVVPFAELAKFQADMPEAIVHTFSNRAHFNDATFPELLELLKR